MNTMRKLTVSIALLLLFGCSAKPVDKAKNTEKYCGDEVKEAGCDINVKADMSGYKDFNLKENQFTASSMKNALAMFKEQKSGILYFGFPKCPWCIEAIPILNEVAKADNIHIQYIRTRDDDKKLLYTEEQKKELIPYVKQYLKKDDEGKYALFVPFVVVVKDGKAIRGHIGTVDSHDAKKREMNKQEKTELKAIYESMFSKLKSDS